MRRGQQRGGEVTCATCGRAHGPAARFCGGCGAALPLRCPACGATCTADAQFCEACGTALGARAAADADVRKVVTIVFADLAGSTSLQERLDAESARRLMDRYYRTLHRVVAAHGGTVVKLLGDGVMAAFGVPRVAEDDALRAVRAAVGMQHALRRLLAESAGDGGGLGLRIAINSGEVVVSSNHADIVGDPVNVAARLQQEARDGEVVIGESTRRLVSELVALAPLGAIALKGRAEADAETARAIELWQAKGATLLAERARGADGGALPSLERNGPGVDPAREPLDGGLTTPPAAPTLGLENGATRAGERLNDALVARDWDRFVALFPAGFRSIDRRRDAQIESGRDEHLAAFRPMFEPFASAPTATVIATRGDRLAMMRVAWTGSGGSGGSLEFEWIDILEVDDRGAPALEVGFDADDVEAAYAELDRRYAAGEAAAQRRAMVTQAFSQAFAARDWPALAALLAPDLVVHDHRLLGWEPLHGVAPYVEALQSLVDLAPDVRLRIDHIRMSHPGFLYVTTWVGSREGGAFEAPSVIVSEIDDEGRIRRFEQYDLDQLAQARARLDAIIAGVGPTQVPDRARQ